ncbi:MAG: glycosyltransferase [Planctomycetota bacterium]
MLGDGELRGPLETYMREHDLGGHVTLHGLASGEEVKQRLLSSRAMVMPSFAEGLPVVLMESLAMGRPAVSTYIAGIPELIRPGETGWLVPAGNPAALAEAMREVLDMPTPLLSSMGRSGYERVVREHNAATEAAKLLSHVTDETDESRPATA